jgi:transcriptional regulator with XRE-family HTH domain
MTNAIQEQLTAFGTRLRTLRLQRGWTLEDLAIQSGLSKAFLSRLESGARRASIAAVLTLARLFDVSLASLFESRQTKKPCLIVRAGEQKPQQANGLTYVPLSNSAEFSCLQPLRLTISPRRTGPEHFKHDGEEWIYLLSGRLTLSIAGATYDLEVGDAAHFDSRLPHRLIARGPHQAEVLLVATPLFQADDVDRINSDSRLGAGVRVNRFRALRRPRDDELLS